MKTSKKIAVLLGMGATAAAGKKLYDKHKKESIKKNYGINQK